MRIRLFSLFCLAAFLGVAGTALAAAPAGEGTAVPTNITADRMQYDADGQTVTFTGNVHVTRPDFELWSSRLTAYLEKKSGGQSGGQSGPGRSGDGMSAGQIDRLIAETNVRMKTGTRTGACGKATYTMRDGLLRMEQDPVVIDTSNNNRIAGDVIVFHTRDGRSDVLGTVRAVFSTEDDGGVSLGAPEVQSTPPAEELP